MSKILCPHASASFVREKIMSLQSSNKSCIIKKSNSYQKQKVTIMKKVPTMNVIILMFQRDRQNTMVRIRRTLRDVSDPFNITEREFRSFYR